MAIQTTGSLNLTKDDREEHYSVVRVNENMQKIQDIFGDIGSIDELSDETITLESYFRQVLAMITDLQSSLSSISSDDVDIIVTTWANKTLDKVLDEINNKIGNLNNLNTTDKSNVVSAINEVKAKTNSLTTKNTRLQEAVQLNRTDINALKSEVSGVDEGLRENNELFARLLGIDIDSLRG